MSVKRIPYATQWISEEDIAAVAEVLRGDWLTQGLKVDEFEQRVADYCGARFAVAVSNGTAALHLAALAAGFREGDEVITSPMTFAASANCILYCGARPVFADIDPRTCCLDPAEAAHLLSARTRGIIPVHFAGHPCSMQALYEMAQRSDLVIIEDGAHALGASYLWNGKTFREGCCAHSHMTIFSFHAVKHLTTGEGGMITTNDEKLYGKLRLLRSHGITRDPSVMECRSEGDWYYEMLDLGFNYRITDFQCALGISQLARLDAFLARRREIAARYSEAFSRMPRVVTPFVAPDVEPAFHLYVVRLEGIDRKEAFERLRERGIDVNVHYRPVYMNPYYRKLGYAGTLCPHAEKAYAQTLTLPLYPRMTDGDVDHVIRAVEDVVEALSERRIP